MEQERLRKFTEIVATSYKSLEDPDFSFVEKAFNARPYDPLIKRLRDYAAVEDLPAAEDDVCFSYLLKGRDSIWKVDLSVVGPFAIFLRLKARVAVGDFLHVAKPDLIAFERKIMDVLQSGGIRLLTVPELKTPVPLNLFNTPKGEVSLYQALFSDRPFAVQA